MQVDLKGPAFALKSKLMDYTQSHQSERLRWPCLSHCPSCQEVQAGVQPSTGKQGSITRLLGKTNAITPNIPPPSFFYPQLHMLSMTPYGMMLQHGVRISKQRNRSSLLSRSHLLPPYPWAREAAVNIQFSKKTTASRKQIVEGLSSQEELKKLAEQPQLSQPVLIGEVFHPSHHFRGPPLDLLQQLHVLVVLRTPELDAVLQVGSHQSRAEGQNHLPRPAGHAAFDAAQGTVGFLGCQCTLLAHVQLFIHQYPQVLLHRAALNPFIPQPVLILGVALTQVQDLNMGLNAVP
ncbi:hypothetical protein QYF61_004128 [Mycteria americana]|uniref:Uncharacterized protein n=1 Tax=Mycteria americana TaxID=33587 RepID=A0AAN7RVF5_MYCAM|nr:hypothetical protein QYF61_004128 [Mycteria americana]